MKLKKMLSVLLCLALMCALLVPALAAPAQSEAITITTVGVSGEKTLDTSALPLAPYYAGETLMLPLRLVGEALGLTVRWDRELHAAVIEDSCQSAAVGSGSVLARFTGKLEIIDMTRGVTMAAPAYITGGCTYVPAALFEELFCTVTVDGANVRVEMNMATLD